MKVVTNERLIQRNRKIGQYTTIASLAILGLGLYLSFNTNSQMVILSFVALILGFALSQVGIYFGNRWGRTPRTDQALTSALKGLSENYTLYNYSSPVPHLLVGTTGAWILIPYYVNGRIVYENNRWRQKGGGFYMKLFGQNNLGRPDLEMESQVETLKRKITKTLPENELGEPLKAKPILVFFNEKAEVDAENAPAPTLPIKKLKDYLRKRPKAPEMTPEMMDLLDHALSNV